MANVSFKDVSFNDRSNAIKIIGENFKFEINGSEFVGVIGDKIKVNLKVLFCNSCQYGVLYIFEDEQHDIFLWYTTSQQVILKHGRNHHVTVGDIVSLNGRIKAHEVFNNVQTTFVTRCKLLFTNLARW